jgi:hypothetical protein
MSDAMQSVEDAQLEQLSYCTCEAQRASDFGRLAAILYGRVTSTTPFSVLHAL